MSALFHGQAHGRHCIQRIGLGIEGGLGVVGRGHRWRHDWLVFVILRGGRRRGLDGRRRSEDGDRDYRGYQRRVYGGVDRRLLGQGRIVCRGIVV